MAGVRRATGPLPRGTGRFRCAGPAVMPWAFMFQPIALGCAEGVVVVGLDPGFGVGGAQVGVEGVGVEGGRATFPGGEGADVPVGEVGVQPTGPVVLRVVEPRPGALRQDLGHRVVTPAVADGGGAFFFLAFVGVGQFQQGDQVVPVAGDLGALRGPLAGLGDELGAAEPVVLDVTVAIGDGLLGQAAGGVVAVLGAEPVRLAGEELVGGVIAVVSELVAVAHGGAVADRVVLQVQGVVV